MQNKWDDFAGKVWWIECIMVVVGIANVSFFCEG